MTSPAMKMAPALWLSLLLVVSTLAHGQGHDDAVQWLSRTINAAHKQNYAGVFVLRSASRNETARIVHLLDGNNERERLEVLEGAPREVLRDNGEVRCFLPSQRLVILEKESRQRFPFSLPSTPESLQGFYHVRKGSLARVAGRESQEIILEPKDALRYGHRLWIDSSSGLLLKSSTLDEHGTPLEQFVFTEVQIGGHIAKEALKSPLPAQASQWKIHDARNSEPWADNDGWTFKTPLPGFQAVASMRRQLHEHGGEALHMVFSDGMASISVFVEKTRPARPQAPGFSQIGNTHVFKRSAGEHLITVLGDVPPTALKRLADGMERN